MSKKLNLKDKQALLERMQSFKRGDVISFYHAGKWFIQYVESTSGELSKTPSIWCNRVGHLPYQFLMSEENITWIRGIHKSILGKVA